MCCSTSFRALRRISPILLLADAFKSAQAELARWLCFAVEKEGA
eukprot:CAMPEP_0202418820 /NCGR_PEP_ID=MMETSP1128-20130828/47459_1 /ASSEMBLY_ACC=CAM_ASM_000463 /TAXON_ID=3047 /ORGANISM="Dunaliella tertiolecta, Strain CCMP1320" /LENGTH=43 /DNA_ID= /DNA_START= /DNA_END= /DNA_ORIENTATION=